MAVVINYAVVRENKGTVMTFTSKEEADAYDKMLDSAEALDAMLEQIVEDSAMRETISMHLATNRDTVLEIFGAKRKPRTPRKSKDTGDTDVDVDVDQDAITEPDE